MYGLTRPSPTARKSHAQQLPRQHSCFWARAGSNHIGNFLFPVISVFFVFWTHGNCRYGHLKILYVFVKTWNFEIFGPFVFSKGHIWTSMSITSGRKIIYGPHGPYISGGKSICGPYGTYISSGSPYMDLTNHIFLVEHPYVAWESIYFWEKVLII